MTVPDTFRDQDHYDEWLADLAETEMENYLHDMDGEDLHVDSVHEYVYESPVLHAVTMDWASLFFDVKRYAHVDIMKQSICIPQQNPFIATADAVESAVREDLACRVHELLESEGYEVGP